MWKFIKYIFLFNIPILFVYFILLFNQVNKSQILFKTEYIYNTIYSEKRLDSLKQISNKIIFIGGSNLFFGIDKYLVERKVGRKVVSFAHTRTDGIENMLSLAERVYKAGDIILLSLEYGSKTIGDNGLVLKYFLTKNPFYLTPLIFRVKNTEKYKSKIDSIRYSVYLDYNVDFYINHLNNNNYRFVDNRHIDDNYFKYDSKDLSILSNFTHKNSLYAVHPIIYNQKLSAHNLKLLQKNKTNLLPLKYITKQKNYIYDSIFIYDYHYHLNNRGRNMRSEKLSVDIIDYFGWR